MVKREGIFPNIFDAGDRSTRSPLPAKKTPPPQTTNNKDENLALKKELSRVSRKYDHLLREYENMVFLYKQATSLRYYNEHEKDRQMLYNQMLRDNCPDDLFLLDDKLKILLCTSKVKEHFLNRGLEVEGQDILALMEGVFDENFTIAMQEAIAKTISTKQSSELEGATMASSQQTKHFSVNISPALNEKEELTGMVVLLHDTTDLYLANVRAEEASRAKGDFLSRMSHEIRTPLNAIIGMTSIARGSDDATRQEYCLEKVDVASKHLLGIINDILDISKIEANKYELVYAEFVFERMLMNVAEIVRVRAEEKRQTLLVNLVRGLPYSIIGDELRLSQVITNLLTNSVKFTPEGGTITLNALPLPEVDGQSSLQIEVIDTGIGVSQEQQTRMFSSFEQAESSTAHKYGGTGLGLTISKGIVELMGGNIWVESELGRGTKISFVLEYQHALDESPTQIILEKKDVHILAVDPLAETRVYFRRLFSEYAIDCNAVATKDEALHELSGYANRSYNVFFIDWHLPDNAWIEVTKKIKANNQDCAVILMISVTDWNAIEKEATEIGVDAFISKPLFPSVMIDTINQCLGLRTGMPSHNEKKGTCEEDVFQFKGFRILVAEDVEVNREIVSAFLEETGIDIEYAENGAEAVAMFNNRPDDFDLILMDIHMPEMDGYTATETIRSLDIPQAHHIPIVAMTANVFREDIEHCMRSGMDDHLGKPLDMAELCKTLGKYLISQE